MSQNREASYFLGDLHGTQKHCHTPVSSNIQKTHVFQSFFFSSLVLVPIRPVDHFDVRITIKTAQVWSAPNQAINAILPLFYGDSRHEGSNKTPAILIGTPKSSLPDKCPENCELWIALTDSDVIVGHLNTFYPCLLPTMCWWDVNIRKYSVLDYATLVVDESLGVRWAHLPWTIKTQASVVISSLDGPSPISTWYMFSCVFDSSWGPMPKFTSKYQKCQQEQSQVQIHHISNICNSYSIETKPTT